MKNVYRPRQRHHLRGILAIAIALCKDKGYSCIFVIFEYRVQSCTSPVQVLLQSNLNYFCIALQIVEKFCKHSVYSVADSSNCLLIANTDKNGFVASDCVTRSDIAW